jgi:uncharacterized protein YcfL
MNKLMLVVLSSLFAVGCSSMSPTSPSIERTVAPELKQGERTMLWDSTEEVEPVAPKAIIWGW